jgi:hypothetical protein
MKHMGKQVHTGCWMRKLKENFSVSEAHEKNKYIQDVGREN